MYAHYFKYACKHFLIVSETWRPMGDKVEFASKKACKEYAEKNNLICWNF